MSPVQSNHTPENTLLQKLAGELASQLIKKYRVSHERAVIMVLGFFEKKPDLLKLVDGATNVKSITRTRIYKEAARDVTRKVYYDLRRYQEQDDIEHLIHALSSATTTQAIEEARLALVKNHVSTAERLAHTAEFWHTLSQHWGQPERILDVGCGILPLLYPFEQMPVKHYLALDRSLDSVNTIDAFKDARQLSSLKAAQWSIDQGWDEVYSPADPLFDVALLLKLVPVVARQEPESLAILARTPAKRMIVTGCKTAMVKQKDISRREKMIVSNFAEKAGLEVLDIFETPDEVGFVLQR